MKIQLFLRPEVPSHQCNPTQETTLHLSALEICEDTQIMIQKNIKNYKPFQMLKLTLVQILFCHDPRICSFSADRQRVDILYLIPL